MTDAAEAEAIPQADMFVGADFGVSPREVRRREEDDARRREEEVRRAAYEVMARMREEPSHAPQVPLPDLDGEQVQALASVEAFLAGDAQRFVLHGLAGTGKTTVLGGLARAHPKAMMVAPTGKAASVLARKTGMETSTIHSLLYAPPMEDERGRLVFNQKRCPSPGAWSQYVCLLDEASMVDERLAADLLETGIRVVAAGDPGQLPPVNGNQFFTEADMTLRHIRRQAADSPIIRQAHAVREGRQYESDGEAFRVMKRRDADELMAAGWPSIVLCWRNETRHRINQRMRVHRKVPYPTSPQPDEPVMCLENRGGMMNGEVFTVGGYDKERGMVLRDGPSGYMKPKGLWFEWQHDSQKQPRRVTPFALAYGATVHKAQGSEWGNILVLDEFDSDDRARWLYTAITRASSAVAIVRREDLKQPA